MIRSYPKVFALGHKAIEDIFLDPVTVQEKIDGSQFSFGNIDNKLECRSKNKQLLLEAPEKMFSKAVDTAQTIFDVHDLPNNFVFRCEYLQTRTHNTLSYDRVPEGNLILYDVSTNISDEYFDYETVQYFGHYLGLEVVPQYYYGEISSFDQFKELLEHDSCLGGTKVEGVVIKNRFRYGGDKKLLMGKYVSERFKETHKEKWGESNPSQKTLVQRIIDRYKTEARWDKAVQHLAEKGELLNAPQDIGNLFKEVQSDVYSECGDEIKDMLFKHYWREISKGINRGLPEWYKERLAKNAFGEE